MSEPVDLLRRFFTAAGFEEVPTSTRTYTRADLVRFILGQQWAEAMRCHLVNTDGYVWFCSPFMWTWSHLPSPDDVVTAMEQV